MNRPKRWMMAPTITDIDPKAKLAAVLAAGYESPTGRAENIKKGNLVS